MQVPNMAQLHGAPVAGPTIGHGEMKLSVRVLETDGAPVFDLTRLFGIQKYLVGLCYHSFPLEGCHVSLHTLFAFACEEIMCPEMPSGLALLVSRDPEQRLTR